MPSREIFWNMPNAAVFYTLAGLAVGILVFALSRHYKLWRVGRPDTKFNHLGPRLRSFIYIALIDGLLHRKLLDVLPGLGHRPASGNDLQPRELVFGVAHIFIFLGCGVLLIAAFIDFISHYFFHFMQGSFYLGFSVVVDVFGILILIGVIMALIHRYVIKPERLDNKPGDLVAMLLIFFVVMTGFITEGYRLAATELTTHPDWAVWSPGGYVFALAFRGMSQETLLLQHSIVWWLHTTLALGAIIYVSLSLNPLWHLILSPLNAFFRSLEPKGALSFVSLQQPESFGAAAIENMSWKNLLDLDTCVRCGRCQANCPAYLSGKALNPRTVIQNLKTDWVAEAPRLLAAKPGNGFSSKRKILSGEVIKEDEIWACSTCGACREACPAYIQPMTKIIELRRNLVDAGSIPVTASRSLESMGLLGNPWEYEPQRRTDWTTNLKVPMLKEKGSTKILYWVGCTGAYDAVAQLISAAMVSILEAAGIEYAILGAEERCCGSEARRLGEEGLFQTLAQANIQLFGKYNVEKIVTACPHCYNTLKNEYTQLDATFEVVHHSSFIHELLRQGKIKTTQELNQRIAFHDPCYLGRHNDVYEAPRQVLESIAGVHLVEMSRNHERSFCCGGGGGQLWVESSGRERTNYIRFRDAQEIGCQMVATACPFCKIMLDEAAKSADPTSNVKIKDIAELICEAR